MRPRLRAGLACALGALVVAQTAQGHYPPGPAKPCGSDAVQTKDAWTVIKSPPGLDRIVTHAAGGEDGKLLLASDGRKVMRSADGGCTWDAAPVYVVPSGEADTGGALPTVGAVVFAAADASQAFLIVDGIGRAAGSQLLGSQDGGRTWKRSDVGLPGTGRFADVVGHGDRLYVPVASNDAAADNDAAGVTGRLYASTDGGQSWESRSSGVQIERLAADPLDGDKLFVVRADHTIQRSDDGGRSWSAINVVADPDDQAAGPAPPGAPAFSRWRQIAVAHEPGGPLTIVVAASAERGSDVTRVIASENGAANFRDLPVQALGPLAGIAFGNSPQQVLVVSGSDSSAFHGPALRVFDLEYGFWRDVDDLELVSLREARPVMLSAAARGHSGLRALEFRRDAPNEDPPAPDLIARYTPPDPPPAESLFERVRCDGAPKPLAPSPPAEKRVRFDPDELELALKPGQPQRVDLKAALRPVPTPLDVYFIIDSTTSMDAPIDGVKCALEAMARELDHRGVDATFGLATYSGRYTRRYARLLDLEPFGPGLHDALERLRVIDGNEEPIRTALFQTATGAGLDFVDMQNDANGFNRRLRVQVAPGQQASFRPGALHTAMVIGNEPYEETTPGEPSREQVVEALKAKGILSIGVQVLPPFLRSVQPPSYETDPDQGPAKQAIFNQQLRYFAQQTGALAPPGGVDCDGGGQPDLQEGEPLVCQVDARGVRETMGDTLVALLTQFREKADVRLVPRETDGLSVAVEGGEAKDVDIKRASEIAGTAVLSCTAAQAGHTYDLSFAVMVGERTVGTLPAAARCGAKIAPVAASKRPRRGETPAAPAPSPSPAKSPSPAPPQPSPAVPAPAPPHPAAVVAPAPPPPSPAPVTPTPAASPSASTAAASSASPAASANPAPGAVAAAQQRETKIQVAQVRGEHAMTAWRPTRAEPRDAVPAPALITLGLGACAAFGFVGRTSAARRRQPRVAPQRVRR